jgi:hypothetical protein
MSEGLLIVGTVSSPSEILTTKPLKPLLLRNRQTFKMDEFHLNHRSHWSSTHKSAQLY